MSSEPVKIHGIKSQRPNPDIHYISEIKQHLFLFDSIGITDINGLKHATYNQRDTFDELLGLECHNLIFETRQSNVSDLIVKSDGSFDSVPRPGMVVSLDGEGDLDRFIEAQELKMLAEDKSLSIEARSDASARVFAYQWNHIKPPVERNEEFYPLITLGIDSQKPLSKSDLHRVVVEKFPVPHPATPIEHLLDFRANSDNASRLIQFKKWMNKVGKSGYTKNELNQELEALMEAYSSSLKKHKIKNISGILETGIVALIDLKSFGALTLFKVLKSAAKVFASEKPGEGDDISYLIKANMAFDPKNH